MEREYSTKRGGLSNAAVPRLSAIAGLVMVLVVAGLLPAGPTRAAAPAPAGESVFRSASFDAVALKASVRTAAQLATDTRAQSRIRMFLSGQARNGRLVDAGDVHMAQLPDPYLPGKTIDLVWDGSKGPSQLTYTKREDVGVQNAVAMSVEYTPAGRPALNESQGPISPGAGYGWPTTTGTLQEVDSGCTQTFFEPQYLSTDDHNIISCFQSLKEPGKANWIYNRWSTWTPAPTIDWTYSRWTGDLYVASRPWKGVQGSYITALKDYQPREVSDKCYTVVTLELGAPPASASIPFTRCENFIIKNNINDKRIGIDLFEDGQGHYTEDSQITMDIAGLFTSNSTTQTNVWWADYNFVTVQWCSEPFGILCDPDYSYAAKDSGW